jgi:hypothetical protein
LQGENRTAYGDGLILELVAQHAHAAAIADVPLIDTAEFLCKTTDYYAPEHERCIAWNDPTLAIQWPELGEAPKPSAKGAAGVAYAGL